MTLLLPKTGQIGSSLILSFFQIGSPMLYGYFTGSHQMLYCCTLSSGKATRDNLKPIGATCWLYNDERNCLFCRPVEKINVVKESCDLSCVEPSCDLSCVEPSFFGKAFMCCQLTNLTKHKPLNVLIKMTDRYNSNRDNF